MFPKLIPAGNEGNMEITYVIKSMVPVVNPDEQHIFWIAKFYVLIMPITCHMSTYSMLPSWAAYYLTSIFHQCSQKLNTHFNTFTDGLWAKNGYTCPLCYFQWNIHWILVKLQTSSVFCQCRANVDNETKNVICKVLLGLDFVYY